MREITQTSDKDITIRVIIISEDIANTIITIRVKPIDDIIKFRERGEVIFRDIRDIRVIRRRVRDNKFFIRGVNNQDADKIDRDIIFIANEIDMIRITDIKNEIFFIFIHKKYIKYKYKKWS